MRDTNTTSERIAAALAAPIPMDLSDCCGARAKGGADSVYCLNCWEECEILDPSIDL